jgi:hypothetical protein
MKNIFKTPSKASPRAGSKRGCLCEDKHTQPNVVTEVYKLRASVKLLL